MEALLTSIGAVSLGEIGDKTQLLALMLAARFKHPYLTVLGILVATLANHIFAGLVGSWIRETLPPEVLRWLLAGTFIAMSLWILKPDKIDCDVINANAPSAQSKWHVFWITVVTFFLAEMGDKTQLATIALAARFDALYAVIAGTTVGMLLADIPAVWLGCHAANKIPIKLVRYLCSLLFIGIGVGILFCGIS